LKAEPARQLVDNAYLSWTWSVLRECSPGGFRAESKTVWGKAQAPRLTDEVEASQGFYCPGFIQPNKQTKNVSLNSKTPGTLPPVDDGYPINHFGIDLVLCYS